MEPKIGIIIYIQPHELDELHRVAIELNKASKYIDTSKFHIVLRMDETYLKTPSNLPQQRLKSILPLLTWTNPVELVTDENIRGTVSLKRWAINKPFTHYVWLDCDIVFPTEILYYIEHAVEEIKDTDYILTPQTVRLWDTTWDCSVHPQFLSKPLNYCREGHNPYHDSGIYGDVVIEKIENTVPNQPKLKFGAGWFTVLHRSVLDKIGIPEGFGHYGPEDTFIMWASTVIPVTQYSLKNIVICEDYTYRNSDYYKTVLEWETFKDQYRQQAEAVFGQELNKIIKQKYGK